jgi:hypothetical protein
MNSRQRFYESFRGNFTSLLSWEQLDESWDKPRRKADAGRYIHAIGMPVPIHPSQSESV